MAKRKNISSKEKKNKLKIIKKKRTKEIITGICLKQVRKSVMRKNVGNVIRRVTFAPTGHDGDGKQGIVQLIEASSIKVEIIPKNNCFMVNQCSCTMFLTMYVLMIILSGL